MNLKGKMGVNNVNTKMPKCPHVQVASGLLDYLCENKGKEIKGYYFSMVRKRGNVLF